LTAVPAATRLRGVGTARPATVKGQTEPVGQPLIPLVAVLKQVSNDSWFWNRLVLVTEMGEA
jgi:hypothetical protein